LALGGCATVPAPPAAVVSALETRAQSASFDGVMLIGEADGSHRIIPVGTDPVAPDAVWRWASITKQLAAVIAMQEVERGRLDLDAPVSRYWPEWRAPNAAKIRIRDLVTHNSGLPQPDESKPDANGVPAFYRSAAASPAAGAAGFCAGPARAAPPAAFDYNNCDTIVLAEVLARITGKPFEALLRERIAASLGLKSLGFYALGTRPGHVEPIGEARDIDKLIDIGVYGASGGAYGTIEDLYRFDRALLDGMLLSAASREAMWTASPSNGFLNFFQWTYPAPLVGCDKPVRIVERQGLIGGIELRNWIMPESGRVLILFSRKRPTELGDPWMGQGLAFDLLSTAVCRP
jgi:CubicO group peptidase (beta-lactamase class C family)